MQFQNDRTWWQWLWQIPQNPDTLHNSTVILVAQTVVGPKLEMVLYPCLKMEDNHRFRIMYFFFIMSIKMGKKGYFPILWWRDISNTGKNTSYNYRLFSMDLCYWMLHWAYPTLQKWVMTMKRSMQRSLEIWCIVMLLRVKVTNSKCWAEASV